MEKNNRIQLPLEEIKLAFAASCVEGAARKLGVPYIEIYERMRKVDLINKFILPHYDTLHTETVTLEAVNALLPELVVRYNARFHTSWTAKDSVKDYAVSPAALEQLSRLLDLAE